MSFSEDGNGGAGTVRDWGKVFAFRSDAIGSAKRLITMPFAPESFPALEELLSRISAEIILARPGHDDGLIPAYSLLGDMQGLCAS
ncbi:MAG: hypothetical protein Q8M02_05775, partial [Candidatus Didemnitutus sp.]|nr:hypothetical protein [Candidatus Didemnitutus sp.]